ncbi:MAG: hypothetical protein WD069_07775 [Planctomycetales bacterium]
MDPFTRSDLRNLIERPPAPGETCISIYMPSHRTGREVRENALRCKNLLNQADERLKDAGLRSPEARVLLAPLRELQEDGLFWKNQSDGLAMFASPGFSARFRMPLVFDELLLVNRRFHVAPILPLLQGDGRFHLLAVSQNRLRFLQGTKHAISELEVEGLPKSLQEALDIDEYVTPALQFQSQTSRGLPGHGEAIFHGHGGSNLDVKKKEEIRQYFRRVDAGLRKFFGEERTPLVFAGVDYLFPIFREACSYRGLLDEPVLGNPDLLNPQQLHDKAWRTVQPYFRRDQEAALQRFHERVAGKGQSTDLDEVIHAAREGRVETLFVARGQTVWGLVDPDTGEAQRVAASVTGSEDLLDHAAVHTLLHDGVVYAVDRAELPDDGPIAALFRYVP